MKRSPYPAPAACQEARFGARATQALGRALPAEIAAHVARCTACRVQRSAFAGLDAGAVEPARGMREAARRAARARLS